MSRRVTALSGDVRLVIWITLSAALLGASFGYASHSPLHGGLIAACAHGALVGGLDAAILSSLEIFLLRPERFAQIRRLPFLLFFALRSSLYLGVILLVLAVASRPVAITHGDLTFSLVASLGYNLLLGVNALLGPGVLIAFVAGRYYRPRLEERALLFIDMRSSTAIAERLGEARFLDFLNRFIADVSLAILEAGGEIHKYVGDEVIATWTLAAGRDATGCIEACFGALRRLAAAAPAYQRDFGISADFRAGLHCGTVAVGELGEVKKEIALIGDAMNTAARIQQACREADCRALASAALLARVSALPARVAVRALGPLPMRGKQQPVALFALEAVAAPAPVAPR